MKINTLAIAMMGSMLAFGSVANAQGTIANPAAEAAQQAAKAAGTDVSSDADRKGRQTTYDMKPITIVGQPLPTFKEDELIGDWAQPRWTAQRLFSGTRIYVIPNGTVNFEQWLRFEVPKHGGPTVLKAQSELEFGLPNRFQIDLYLNTTHEIGTDAPASTGVSAEVRWALADWGKIWGNPTLYLEYTSNSGEPDELEGKLLLGDTLVPGWHWGVNLSVEQQLSGARATETMFTGGISYSLIDTVFDVGIETRLARTNVAGSRSQYENDYQIGPTFRWSPTKQMHLDIAPLFGLTSESAKVNAYLIFGWEF